MKRSSSTPRLVAGAEEDDAVGPLPGLAVPAAGQWRPVRVAARAQPERVRPARLDGIGIDHRPSLLLAPDATRRRRSRSARAGASSASSWRRCGRRRRRRSSTSASTTSASATTSGCGDAQLLRGALPVARPDHRARPARRAHVHGAVSGGALCPGRRAQPPVRGRRVRRRLLERRDRARRRRGQQQQRFVDESLRVAPRAFVTTPNRWFPIEVHTRLPLVHWLPEAVAHRAYDLVRKPWAKDNHLLGPGELRGALSGARAVRQLRDDAGGDR